MGRDEQADAGQERRCAGLGGCPTRAVDGYLAVLGGVLASTVDDRDHELDEHVRVGGQEPLLTLPVGAGVAEARSAVEVVTDLARGADMDHATPQTSIWETGDTAS